MTKSLNRITLVVLLGFAVVALALMYWSVVVGLRWPANVAIVCNSQPARARSVKQRWRSVWVLNAGTPAAVSPGRC